MAKYDVSDYIITQEAKRLSDSDAIKGMHQQNYNQEELEILTKIYLNKATRRLTTLN